MAIRTQEYWECDCCDDDYIHSKDVERCELCNTDRDDAPYAIISSLPLCVQKTLDPDLFY